LKRKHLKVHGALWAAALVSAACMHADPFFTTILLPLLATAAFLLGAEDSRRRHACRRKD